MGWSDKERSRDMAHDFLVETPALSLHSRLTEKFYMLKINTTPNCSISGLINNDLGGCYDINGIASSIIQKQTKTLQLLQNNVEVKVVEKTDGAFNYSCWIFLENLQTGESVEIRTYVWNPQTNDYELYESPIITKASLTGSQTTDTNDDKPAFFLPPVQSDRLKITITQLSGTPRAFDWVLYKQ